MAEITPIGQVINREYPKCKESGCPNVPGVSGFCCKHGSKVKVTKPISRVSDKRKIVNRNLGKIIKELKATVEICTIKSPVCNGLVQTGNHIQKRLPNNIDDPDNIEACCYPCNKYVEDFPNWAKENGHHKIK